MPTRLALVVLALIGWALPASAQVTLNRVYYTDATSATSMVLPGGVPTTIGNTLVIAIDTPSNGMAITGASDNKGNAWVVGPGSVDVTGGTSTYIIRTTGVATAGVTTITVTSTGPSGTSNFYLYDLTLSPSTYTVTSNFASNQPATGTTTNPVGPSITPTGAGIVIAVIAPSPGAPHSVASPFTLTQTGSFSAYNINTSTSTVSPNWTMAAGTWDATILSIVPAGGGCPSTANMDGGLYAAPAHCYYVDYASGSDTNAGTVESAPLQRAPGMTGCASNCLSVTVGAGVGIIFKGGVTWPYNVLPWGPGVSGATGGNDAYGGCTGANCIYFGVDKSWFTGASWTRPKFSGGDWSTAPTGSGGTWSGGACFYDLDASSGANRFLSLINQHDIILDNFEFLGGCLQEANAPPGGNNPVYVSTGGSTANVVIENSYFHRPAYNIGTSASGAAAFDAVGGGGKVHMTYDVVDFGDAGPVTTFIASNGLNGFACCGGTNGSQFYEDHNVFTNLGACEDEIGVVSRHDNLFYNCYATTWGGGFHEHLSNDASCSAGQTITNYNNVIYNSTVSSAQVYGFTDNAACVFYVFNDVSVSTAPPYYAYATGASGNTFYFFNDTVEAQDSAFGGPGGQIFTRGGGANGTGVYENLHVVTTASQCAIFNIGTGSGGFAPLKTFTTTHGTTTSANFTSYPGCPVADLVVQTQATANGQGYTIGQTYMFSPAVNTAATVGAGVNHTGYCSAIAASNAATAALDAAACQLDTSYAVTYNQTSHTAVVNGRTQVARPTSTPWDAGAYQFAGGPPPPPTGPVAPGTVLFGSAGLGVGRATP